MNAVDVIVLGGGIIGCSLAEELARRGQRVVVIERGRIGAEASSAAAGILASQEDIPHPGAFFELCQAARRMYPAWVRHVQQRSGIDVEWSVDGILYVAVTARQARAMERQARWQTRAGYPVERWSGAEILRREPAIDGRVHAGFVFPREAQVDNVRLMAALAQACRRAGVRVREQTTVRRLLITGRTVRGVVTDRGTIRSSQVINCLGSWAAMGGAFPIQMPVEPARGQILMFRGPQRLFRHPVMSDQGYVVQRRDGRLLLGSTIERAGFEKALTVEGIHKITCGLRRLSRALNACTFVEAWAGFRPLTPDRLPILGSTPIDGLYVATGHYRHGILLAPITAQLMADLLQGRRPRLDLSPYQADRF